ncbi:MAG: HTH domain-containing protein [Candidatus Pacearchaeota archaeon]
MFEWFFGKKDKKEADEIKKEVRNSFSLVKKDINKITTWINHLNEYDKSLSNEVNSVKEEISNINDQIEQIKDLISMISDGFNKQLFKTSTPVYRKQTGVDVVQTGVQTGVQTANFYGFSNLSATERAIIWILINNDLKLSYDDLAAMLGKTRSTIRGQINSIKQKSVGLIEEYIEKNGKKRVYIPEEIKQKILKKTKVRVKKDKE